jgi:transposase
LNASQLTEAQRAELRERLHQYRPDQVLAASQLHSSGQFWTVVDLKNVVQHWYGVAYADMGSYRRLLHRCGFSYQRAERIYKSRPGAQVVADFEAELEKKSLIFARTIPTGSS